MSRTSNHCRRAGVAIPAFLAACALSAPPADATLAQTDSSPAGADAELDRLAAAALARAEQAPEDADAAVAAAALLFQAADLRLQRACRELLAAGESDLDAVLAADDRIVDPARTEILSLCRAGAAAAQRAAEREPRSVAAQLRLGLNLSLEAWANGPARSLFQGLGPRLVAAIDAAVAADPTFDSAAPLRLLGRFRGQAPWPYGDLPAAVTALRRAVAQAPLTVNHLFLGDALWRQGEREGARAEWAAAAAAVDDDSTRWSGDLLRQLARCRLEALRRQDRG